MIYTLTIVFLLQGTPPRFEKYQVDVSLATCEILQKEIIAAPPLNNKRLVEASCVVNEDD